MHLKEYIVSMCFLIFQFFELIFHEDET